MKRYLSEVLSHYEFYSLSEFWRSLFPSVKFDASVYLVIIGVLSSIAETFFGMDFLALGGMLLMFVLELATGLLASHYRKEQFTSRKLSRFGVKVACYLIIISIPYLFYVSYSSRGNTTAATVFEWLHVFLVMHVIQEHLVSILENLASIQGKDKSYWIEKIKNQFKSKS